MKPALLLSLGNFFAAAHYFLVIYISAPYLATLMPHEKVGLVVAAGAVLALLGYLVMPYLVRQFGPRTLALCIAVAAAVLLALLGTAPSAPIAIGTLALLSSLSLFLGYQIDLLLEAATDDEHRTGATRTLFITTANVALIATPLVLGLLLGEAADYSLVFLTASLTLIPFIVLMMQYRFLEDDHAHLHGLMHAATCLARDKDIRMVVCASFLLNLFFYLAPLYIPLYLNTVLGMPWSELGWIFAVALIPFVLLEYPAGWMADNHWGDKELMAFGFFVAGFFFALVAFITLETPLFWILVILVGTRVGGAIVEAMVEGHFFRRVAASDTSSVAVFRMTRPFAMLAAPILATSILLFAEYGVFFILSGAFIIVAGVACSFCIRDSR